MSDSRNWSAAGEQMKSALAEALQSGDFKNLNDRSEERRVGKECM